MITKEQLESMLQAEKQIMAREKIEQVTVDFVSVRAEIRAEFIEELIRKHG